MEQVLDKMKEKFETLFGMQPEIFASAPARTELGGNHTDHQHGWVMAAAVGLRVRCLAAKTDDGIIEVHSKGHEPCIVRVGDNLPHTEETGNSTALVRGVMAELIKRGVPVGGLRAYTENDIPSGGGMSSSAAFEVLLGKMMCALYTDEQPEAVELAKIGQRAENEYYGKPCGLMDQTACACGGAVGIDFYDPAQPKVEKLDFDPEKYGYTLVLPDCGASHADLTDEYSAITGEMFAVARELGKNVLREADEEEFYASLPKLREKLGDRAVMRAMHFFTENRRAQQEAQALRDGNFEEFLRLVGESGRSSWMYLQNICPCGATEKQPMALTLAMCDRLLEGKGAFRMQGGGFAGAVQAYVPTAELDKFVTEMEKLCGAGSCRVLKAGVRGVYAEKL